MNSLFFTCLIGPLAAFLPLCWRRALPFAGRIGWGFATVLSGIAEFAAAVIALGYWYMFEMSRISDALIDSATSGKLAVGITTTQVSGAALLAFALHPLTWLLVYLLLEATVRICGAAFSSSALGSLPFYLFERTVFLITHRRDPSTREAAQSNFQSFVGSIRERVIVSHLAQVPDELRYSRGATEEFLEIWASRKNADWIAPAIMRVDEDYYRLEESSLEKGTRPFRYRLRRLSKGVPGRKVLLYKTAGAIVKA